MAEITRQMEKWAGKFGREYVDRNTFSPKRLDTVYKKMYGTTATKLMHNSLGKLDKNIRILEVGSNVGNQLALLQTLGFKNLYGIEINRYAVEKAKKRLNGIDIICGSAFDIPYKDGFFDLVFTAGVLIHISPKDIKKALSEIHRVSSKYIWGFEYYSPKYQEKNYRGKNDMMWKGDFAHMYTRMFPKCRVVDEKFDKYLDSDNVDTRYLIKK